MIAEIAVHETEVDKVRPGQEALITVDPFPDEKFKGLVLKVSDLPDAQRGWLNPDLKVYPTEVLIKGTHDFLKPGMSAKVEILVEHLKDVIIVPITVIANRQGKKICFVVASDGSQDERVVKTGAFDDTFVQIVEGLEAGEKVMLNPPRITETGSGYDSRERSDRFGSDESVDEPNSVGPQPQGPPQRGRREGPAGRGPGALAPGGPGSRRPGAGTPGARQPQGGGGPRAGGGPGGGQFEITDEIADRTLSMLEQMQPEEAKKLKQLRQSDPEKFKAELRQKMRAARNMMQQGGNQGARGGNAGPGRGQN